jgi:hypothetical protein
VKRTLTWKGETLLEVEESGFIRIFAASESLALALVECDALLNGRLGFRRFSTTTTKFIGKDDSLGIIDATP